MGGRCNSCGSATPAELLELLCARGICAGGGLACNHVNGEPCLYVLLEPGGGLEIGPLGGLRNNCCDSTEPIPGACVATVDSLGDFVVGGRSGGAGLLHPPGSPQGIAYALDHSLDMIVSGTWSTRDEIAVWQVYGPHVDLDYYTTSPTTAEGLGVMSSDWLGLTVDAGTTASPTGRNEIAPASYLDPDGGWYGFYAPPFQPQSVAGVLRGLSQRSVVWLDVAQESDAALATRHVTAAIRAVATACSSASTLIALNADNMDLATNVANAGYRPAVYLNNGQRDVTPDQIPAEVEWVRINANWPDDLIAPFVAAGLNVVLLTNSRHWSTLRAQDLGCRGIHADDPVYARGALGEVFQYYRQPITTYVRRQTSLGHLTADTDGFGLIGARWFTKESEYGLFVSVTQDRPRHASLIGDACPLPAIEGSYTFQVQVDDPSGAGLPAGDSPKVGVYLTVDDHDATPEAPQVNGYAIFVRVGGSSTGQLEIGRATADGYVMLAQSTTARAVSPNEWVDLRLEVTAASITLTRTDGTNYSVTTTDTTDRGTYVSWLANHTNPAGDFVAGVRNWTDTNAAESATITAEALTAPAPAGRRRMPAGLERADV